MVDTAAKVIEEIVKEYNGKDKKAARGMIIHPFVRDLKTQYAYDRRWTDT